MEMKIKVKMGWGLAGISACFVIALMLSPTIGVVVIVPAKTAIVAGSLWNVSQVLVLALAVILLIPAILPFRIHRAWAWLLPFIMAIISSLGIIMMFMHNALWANSWGFTLIAPFLHSCYAFSIGMESIAIKTTDLR